MRCLGRPLCVVAGRWLPVCLPLWLLLVALCCGLACGPAAPPLPTTEPPLAPGCNPLGGGPGEDCFTPFPSSVYLEPDAQGTPRLRIPQGVLPTSVHGVPLAEETYNGRDGYSVATPLLAYFPAAAGRLDTTGLPSAGRAGESLLPQSPVQLFEYGSGERVPILAEPDRNAKSGERQALVIYPQLRLRAGTRYVVALTALSNEAGTRLPPLAGFLALRDGPLDAGSARSRLKARYDEIFAFLERQGLSRGSLQLAWDFQTESAPEARLLRMRDTAFATRPTTGGPGTIAVDKVTEKPPGRSEVLRQIQGRLFSPSFLGEDTGGRLLRGRDGEPMLRGIGSFPLFIQIPACVERAIGPVPILIYGHGLLASGQSELDGPLGRELGNKLCMIQVATDWIGLSAADRGLLTGKVPGDFNQLTVVTERLQQALVSFAYLARLLAAGALDSLPELRHMGRTLGDKGRVYYYGAGFGGSLGLSLLSLSPHIPRAALPVSGGFFSQIVWRSSGFRMLTDGLAAAYPDPLDRQILVALSQALWDGSDPATYAAHVLRDPLPGVSPKRVLLQEGLGDAQVPNLATRALVRSMGLSLLGAPVEAVFGVGQVLMSSESAYVQYDIGQQPRPGDTNVPPEKDNGVGRSIPRIEAAKTQLDAFLREDGRVIDTCGPRTCTFMPP